jgi:hypothetical protein
VSRKNNVFYLSCANNGFSDHKEKVQYLLEAAFAASRIPICNFFDSIYLGPS